MPSLQSSSTTDSLSPDPDFMTNAPPTHTIPFFYPSPVPSPTPTPSPTLSELDAIALRHLHANISPADTDSDRTSSASRSSTPPTRRHFSLSPPRHPDSFWEFERPQRSVPKRSHSTEPPRAPPAPPRAPFGQQLPAFSAFRHNAAVLTTCHASASAKIQKEEQQVRRSIRQQRADLASWQRQIEEQRQAYSRANSSSDGKNFPPDWECGFCQRQLRRSINFARRTECYRCGIPRKFAESSTV